MAKDYMKWLYHPAKGGRMFAFNASEPEELTGLLDNGWYESPADFPADADPIKPPDEPVSPPGGINVKVAQLIDKFMDDPESLTKDEHMLVGAGLGIKLSKSMKEETMITKIMEVLEQGSDSDGDNTTDH